MSAFATLLAAFAMSCFLVIPYIQLRIWAANEKLKTALMHAYLPWMAAFLTILGIFGVG